MATLGSLTRGCCLSHEDTMRLKMPRLGIIEENFKWVNEEVAAVIISQTYSHTKSTGLQKGYSDGRRSHVCEGSKMARKANQSCQI